MAKQNMAKIFISKICGLHASTVVVSEYNNNGECKCLNCPGVYCQSCQQYQDLLDESDKKNQLKLERCTNCLKQR